MEQQQINLHFCRLIWLDCSIGGRSQPNQTFNQCCTCLRAAALIGLVWIGWSAVRHWNCRYYSSICRLRRRGDELFFIAGEDRRRFALSSRQLVCLFSLSSTISEADVEWKKEKDKAAPQQRANFSIHPNLFKFHWKEGWRKVKLFVAFLSPHLLRAEGAEMKFSRMKRMELRSSFIQLHSSSSSPRRRRGRSEREK